MTAPPNYISVPHGSLTVNVPVDIFKGPNAEIDEEKAAKFRDMLSKRYPWLNNNSLDVLMRHAREQIIRDKEERSGGVSTSRHMASKGNVDSAILFLQARLERDPNNPDTWYEYGKLLCEKGRIDEGYKAINRGRQLSKTK